MNEEEKIKAIYDGDSKRFHRYTIEDKQIKGALYIPKEMNKIPKKIVIELNVKE